MKAKRLRILSRQHHFFTAIGFNVLLLGVLFLSGQRQAVATERVALVIGCGKYEGSALETPARDAAAIAALLRRAGFAVIEETNPNRSALENAVRMLTKSLSENGVAFFYFAGHAIQVEGENYLVPVGAELSAGTDAESELFSLKRLLRSLEFCRAGSSIVILDCCRNNAFKSESKGGTESGLALSAAPGDVLLSFAATPGTVALPGDSASHSRYTAALLTHLATPGIPIDRAVTAVQEEISESTGNEQRSWFDNRLTMSVTIFPGSDRLVPALPELNPLDRALQASIEHPYVNSLGMEFIPVPGKRGVLMSKTETRVREFRAFVEATGHVQEGGAMVFQPVGEYNIVGGYPGMSWGLNEDSSWEKPGFRQEDDHPVVCVSWEEARTFCEWLSEQQGKALRYRLPADEEWSAAAGAVDLFPWGNEWPPTAKPGNYWDKQLIEVLPGRSWPEIRPGYDDGAAYTNRVARYQPNRHGFFDLGGNVKEWCQDWYRDDLDDPEIRVWKKQQGRRFDDGGGPVYRVLRDAGWSNGLDMHLRSSFRSLERPENRSDYVGFRVVLELEPES